MKPLVVYESKWLKYINRWPSAITLYPFILFKWTREEVADPRTHIFKHEMWHWYRARKGEGLQSEKRRRLTNFLLFGV